MSLNSCGTNPFVYLSHSAGNRRTDARPLLVGDVIEHTFAGTDDIAAAVDEAELEGNTR
jgi:hypothetical protein